jgi:hypothetical protein
MGYTFLKRFKRDSKTWSKINSREAVYCEIVSVRYSQCKIGGLPFVKNLQLYRSIGTKLYLDRCTKLVKLFHEFGVKISGPI